MSGDVDTRGPMFDGRAAAAARELARATSRGVAEAGARMVRDNLGEVLKHPTGYYQSHVTASPASGNWEVTDNGIVYGPWLEGTGSRNNTTRFKGYATFRRTVQELQRRLTQITAPTVDRYVRRMQ